MLTPRRQLHTQCGDRSTRRSGRLSSAGDHHRSVRCRPDRRWSKSTEGHSVRTHGSGRDNDSEAARRDPEFANWRQAMVSKQRVGSVDRRCPPGRNRTAATRRAGRNRLSALGRDGVARMATTDVGAHQRRARSTRLQRLSHGAGADRRAPRPAGPLRPGGDLPDPPFPLLARSLSARLRADHPPGAGAWWSPCWAQGAHRTSSTGPTSSP